MKTRVAVAEDAEKILRDGEFRQAWESLRRRCPWATAFQDFRFASTWYNVYSKKYDPVLVTGRSDSGELRGLLALARVSSRRLSGCGYMDGEYQVWLADPADGDEFIVKAIEDIHREFSGCGLVLRYLPPTAPTGWTGSGLAGQLSVLQAFARPIWTLGDGSQAGEKLRKTRNRHAANCLRRLGELRLERLTDPARLAELMDDIVDCSDFRHEALHGWAPMRDDPLRRTFHEALVAAGAPTCFTALTAGGRMMSANLGMADATEVHTGMMAVNPFQGRHTPGTIHMLMLGEMLAREGAATLDLTPGGDPYKERFATGHDTAWRLRVFPSSAKRSRHQVKRVFDAGTRRVGKVARRATGWVSEAGRKVVGALQRRRGGELLLYACELGKEKEVPAGESSGVRTAEGPDGHRDATRPLASVDRVGDLLLCPPRPEGWPSRQAFLLNALERIEDGWHFYTIVRDGRLAHRSWVVEGPREVALVETGGKLQVAKASWHVLDSWTDPDFRRQGLASACLRQILNAAARAKAGLVTVTVLPDNTPSRNWIEKAGFRLKETLTAD